MSAEMAFILSQPQCVKHVMAGTIFYSFVLPEKLPIEPGYS